VLVEVGCQVCWRGDCHR